MLKEIMLNAVGGTKYHRKVLTFKPKGSARTLTYKTGNFFIQNRSKNCFFFYRYRVCYKIRTHITIISENALCELHSGHSLKNTFFIVISFMMLIGSMVQNKAGCGKISVGYFHHKQLWVNLGICDWK